MEKTKIIKPDNKYYDYLRYGYDQNRNSQMKHDILEKSNRTDITQIKIFKNSVHVKYEIVL